MISYLRQTRINSGKTLEEISYDLKIRKQYLIALEENDFESIPGEVYVRGYLKLYANYLGIVLEHESEFNNNLNKENILLRDKISTNHEYKKYIISLSIVMLLVISIMYHLILRF